MCIEAYITNTNGSQTIILHLSSSHSGPTLAISFFDKKQLMVILSDGNWLESDLAVISSASNDNSLTLASVYVFQLFPTNSFIDYKKEKLRDYDFIFATSLITPVIFLVRKQNIGDSEKFSTCIDL